METKELSKYAKDRDDAFCAFVDDGDFAHIDELLDKYGVKRIPHTDIGRAGVLKAVQECMGIPNDVKARAFVQCVELGFMPSMGKVVEQ